MKPKMPTWKKYLLRLKWPLAFIAVGGAVLVIFYCIAIRPRVTYGIVSPPWLGNTYELAGALFSALAFAGVILTVLMQAEELRLQRLELRATRRELKRSAKAQEKSEQALVLTAYLSAQNSLFLANEEQIKAEKDDWFRPSSIERTRILVILKALTATLHRRVPKEVALTPSKAVRYCVRCYIRDLEEFFETLQYEGSFQVVRDTLVEQPQALKRFLDMLPRRDIGHLELKALADEIKAILGDLGTQMIGVGVAKISDEQRDRLKDMVKKTIAAMKMYAAV